MDSGRDKISRLLQECGFDDLPPEVAADLLDYLVATVRGRVGMVVVERMDPETNARLEKLFEAGDDDEAAAWSTARFRVRTHPRASADGTAR